MFILNIEKYINKYFYVTLSVYACSFLIVKWSDHIKCRERHCIQFHFYTEKYLHVLQNSYPIW